MKSNFLEKIGWANPGMGKSLPPHDIIEYFDNRSPKFFEIIFPLYKKGLSITDIANQTGLKRGSIWNSLRANRESLRPQVSVPFERWRKGHGKVRNKPPFGYYFFQGELVKDTREYPTVLFIESLWNQGKKVGEIVRELKGKGYRSRMNRDWGYGVVKGIIKRLANSKEGTEE